MAKFNRPLCPPKPVKPACSPPSFTLGSEEQFLFDTIAQEIYHIAGTDIDFYSLDPNRVRDALYDEPEERVFKGPYRFKGYAEWPASTPETREEGFKQTFEATFYIARKDFDDQGAPYPNEGDVFRIWNNLYINGNAATNNEVIPGGGYYFDAVDVDDQGHLFDNAAFTGFAIAVRRRTEFTPERRISPP